MEKLRNKGRCPWNVVEGDVYSSNVGMVIKSVTGIQEQWVHPWLWIVWFWSKMMLDVRFMWAVEVFISQHFLLQLSVVTHFYPRIRHRTFSQTAFWYLLSFFVMMVPNFLNANSFILLHILNFFSLFIGVKASRKFGTTSVFLSHLKKLYLLNANTYEFSLPIYALWMHSPCKVIVLCIIYEVKKQLFAGSFNFIFTCSE